MPDQDTPPQRLEALNERRSSVRMSAQAQAYSIIVKKLRWALPITAMGILLILLVWPRISKELENIRFKVAPIDQKILEQAATQNTLLSADFASVDSKGRPFHILAEQAVQQNDDANTVQLIKPNGTLKSSETETINLSGDTGVYQQDTQYLTLTNNVVMTRTDGSVMKTEKLNMNMQTNSAATDQPITIDGPQGSIAAQGMTSIDGGAKTVFDGPVKLIVHTNTSLKGGT